LNLEECVLCWLLTARGTQDGDPPEQNTFAERFPELFCRLAELRSPTDPSVRLIAEIKAFRLKGSTQELQDMLADAFASRGLGPLSMTVRLLSGAESQVPAAQGEGEAVSIIIEESTAPDEGRNPYIALGWYSLTHGQPSQTSISTGAVHTPHPCTQTSTARAIADAQDVDLEATSVTSKVVVCLGGGATCNLEYERACSEHIDSRWYCLYLPTRPAPAQPIPLSDTGLDSEGGSGSLLGIRGVQSQSRALQSSVNAAHAAEAEGVVPAGEWRFGGLVYDTKRQGT